METKRILLAAVVLVLTGACVWASTETPSTARFTAIPDNEAAMIVGGDGVGYECNVLSWPTFYLPCEGQPQSMCSNGYAFNETWMCGYTGSGVCYDQPTIVGWYCECEWTNGCQQSGDWVPFWGTDCM